MSKVRADSYSNRLGTGAPSFPTGAVITGVITATTFKGDVTGDVTGNADTATTATTATNALGLSGTPDITVNNITGAALTASSGNITGALNVGGVLTYADVSSVDSVGMVTARKGLQVLADGANITGIATVSSDVSIADKIIHTGDTNTAIRFPAADTFTVETGGSERIRVDSSGRLLVGATASSGAGANLQVIGNNALQIHRGVSGTGAANINISKSRNATYGSFTVVQDGDTLGTLQFRGDDGSDYQTDAAAIQAQVDGTPGSNDMPGRLLFSTTADGASSVTERLRITSRGDFIFSNGSLIEKVNITAGKLSANTNIDLENGMAHFFTTTEATTSTPNIRVSSSKALNDVMSIGDVVSVSIITTAAAAGYSAQLTIDGGAVTEEWNGGSAPTEGGAGGFDFYSYSIIKTANATFTVLANLSNFA